MDRVRLQRLARTFETPAGRLFVLRQLDLRVAPGEFLAVMGPSGAGKSTLLSIIGLLDPEFEGGYWLDGTAVHELTADARRDAGRDRIGFIFQRYHLIDDLTVAENLALPLEYRDVPRAEMVARVEDMLQRFDLDSRRRFFPPQLSGGEQQIVAIARASIHGPDLIVADEPTGALHSDQGRVVMDHLEAARQGGASVIMVTHSADNAVRADRTVQLSDGWLEGGDAAA